MNLHHVDHSGANKKYYLAVLSYINKEKSYGVNVTQSSLGEFIDKGAPEGTDVLSYQTFPDEYNPKKFNPQVIEKSDLQFHLFRGRKLLVDTHDNGDKDAFSRMVSGIVLPRVKCFPSKWYLKNHIVVLISTASTHPGVYPDKLFRDITISCKFGKNKEGFYDHPIREIVQRYLDESFLVDCEWVDGIGKYMAELRRTKIVIGAPGWGAHNASYWGAMKAGALLFAHRTLNDIKLFPHSDLIDGEDYISYDLFNFKRKLDRIFHQPEEIERIRKNGRRKFEEGLNYQKSADQLVNFLKGGRNELLQSRRLQE